MPAVTERERELLFALFDTFVPMSEIRDVAFENVITTLGSVAPHRFEPICQFLSLLENPLFSLALIRKFVPFAKLSQSDREKMLCKLSDSPVPQFRTAFQAMKRLCLYVNYSSVDSHGRNPLWADLRYEGPRKDVQEPKFRLPISYDLPERSQFDAIVVGSGAGGGVAAQILAKSGRRTLVLEVGDAPYDVAGKQLEGDAMASLYLDKGLTSSTDLGVAMLAGSGVGGGTTINWSTSLRLDELTAEQWTKASGGVDFGAGLSAHYDVVSARMGVAPSTFHNPNNAVLAKGLEALGWHSMMLPRNAQNCGDGCGYCGFGCAYNSKKGTADSFLIDAVEAGATIVAKAEVERVVIKGGKATGVVVNLSGGTSAPRTVRVDAPLVVVSGGALRTPGILGKSGVTNRNLGKHLHVHPVSCILSQFDHDIDSWAGPIQTAYSAQFKNLHDGYGAVLEVAPGHPGLATHARAWRSKQQHYLEMLKIKHSACLIAIARDRGSGTISTDGKNDISYDLSRFDADHIVQGLVGSVKIALAAGAKRILTTHANPLVLRREDATSEAIDALVSEILRRGIKPNRIAVFSAHQMGSARMSVDPSEGVVNEDGQVHGVSGLYVADSSLFPLASGVNPMLTIMALSHRNISKLVETASAVARTPATIASSAG
jgi:choline dehydrogenase-like flavoprotein